MDVLIYLLSAIELNLRPPSMLHGKKGFERLRWACKNVLDQSVTWLFYDCQPAGSATAPNSPGPIGMIDRYCFVPFQRHDINMQQKSIIPYGTPSAQQRLNTITS